MAKFVLLVQESRFQWKVENALSTNTLDSDEFALSGHQWQLRVYRDSGIYYTNGYYNSCGAYLNVSLSKLNPEKLNWISNFRAFIEDRNGKPVVIREHVFDNSDFTTQKIWWISIRTLQDQRTTYLTDGTLTFVIAFTHKSSLEKDAVDEKVSDKSSQTSVNMDAVANLENLSLDFHGLLDDDVHSDVTLTCEERSFPAHKLVLSARSEVFSAMFLSDMAESRTGVIEISDVDASVLDQFLHYVYSGKLPDLSVDTASKLYAASDKYSVESLKKSCAKFMEENLTRENACKILVLADTHGDKHLKDSVLCFIRNVELLQNRDVWLEFHNEHPKLAGEAVYHAYQAKRPSIVN